MDDVNDTHIQVDEVQHVVRTFASDMAAATGKNPAADPAAISPPTAAPITPAPASETHGTAAPSAFVPAPAPKMPPPVSGPIIYENIVADPVPASTPRPVPGAPAAPSPAVPAFRPSAVAAAVASSVAEAAPPEPAVREAPVEEARMSILDRLRARASGREEVVQPDASLGAAMIAPLPDIAPSDVPLSSVKIKGPAKAPWSPKPTQEESAPPLPDRSTPPAWQPATALPNIPTTLPSPIHTYTSDFAGRIGTEHASAFSVLAAQSDAAPVVASEPKREISRTTIIFATIGIVLLIGAGVLGYVAFKAAQPKTVAVAPGVPSLIFFDDKEMLSGSGGALMNALAQSASEPLSDGQVKVVYLGVPTATAAGTTTVPGNGGTFINALQLPAPDILLRNINQSSTVGVINAGGDERAFFILSVASYDATFSGMLTWESTMPRDLALLYPPFPSAAAPVATTTASTTTATSSKPVALAPSSVTSAAQFVDETVSNHDARALKDSAGNTVVIYGYYDETTLVIARNEAAFTEILDRLGATGTQSAQ